MLAQKSVGPMSAQHVFIKSWVLFNISPLQNQIFSLLLTESVSLYMLLQILIGMPLNTFCVIFRVRQHMTYILLIALLSCYMVLQMQIGQAMLMIANLWVVILFFFITKHVEVDYHFV
jgi:hypothetical protein